MIKKIKKFFQGNDRTVRAKKNIVGSVLIKGGSIIISIILVPMTLGYLNSYEYGVWLTLSSVLMWINYFDIGIGNGLRNKLAEALAVNDKKMGQIYISTTFFLLFVIVFSLFLVFLFAQYWIDWGAVLNVPLNKAVDLNNVIIIAFAFFSLSFIFKFIGNVYYAAQLSVVNDLLILFGNMFSLILIYILTLVSKGSLAKVAIFYSAAPVVVYLAAYPYTFYGRFKEIKPKISCIRLKYTKDLMGLGFQFFFIQISCLLTFSTSNIIISHYLGPDQVTPYNIAFKYFSVITMIFNILITPMWSAFTEAFVKKDYMWIKKTIRWMIIICAFFFVVSFFMLFISNLAYSFWVGKNVKIPFLLSFFTSLYVTICNWNGIFTSFVNGIGYIRIQLFCSIISVLIFIPLAVWFSIHLGIAGIMLAMCLSSLPYAVLLPIQYRKIVHRKALGFWCR